MQNQSESSAGRCVSISKYLAGIELSVSRIEADIETHQEQAQSIIDEYWLVWRATNTQYRNIDPNHYKGGEVAPRLTVKSGKLYLVWTRWRPNRHGNVKNVWGDHIKPAERGYNVEQLTAKSPGWEVELISQTEPKLAVLREALDVLHETKVKLNRIIRKHTAKMESQNG